MRATSQLLLLIVALGVGLFLSPAARAQEEDSAAVQKDVLVLLRALAYDRDLAKRFGDDVKVGVIHAGSRPSDESATVLAIIEALKDVKVGGLAVITVPLPWKDAATLSEALATESVDVIYVPADAEAAAAALPEVARAGGKTTMTRSRAYVEAGLALGVEDVEGKPRIVVNLDASRAEGASLAAELLRLADVIK